MPNIVHPSQFGPQSVSLVVALAILVAVLLLRNRRPRALRVERLWIRPLLFLAIFVSTLAAAPPPVTPTSFAVLAAALVVGGALGWQRGRFIHIEVDPTSHDLTSRVSPVGLVFVLALVLVRTGMRSALTGNAALGGLSAALAADALIGLAAAMMAVQSLEMWLRARRLLAQATSAQAVARAPRDPIVR